MTAAQLDMHAVAAHRGVHYDTVRKGWKAWVREQGFPAPVSLRPLRWAGAALLAWEERAEARNRAVLMAEGATVPDVAANENTLTALTPPPALRGVDRQRGALLSLMRG